MSNTLPRQTANTGSLDAYLLTRQWRDTPHGIELVFWGASPDGPVRISVPGQEAVCFIDRQNRIPLPASVRRVARPLQTLQGEPVDVLYWPQQRQLNSARQALERGLHESDIKPADRFLMERFIRAGFRATGPVNRLGLSPQESRASRAAGWLALSNPRLTATDLKPRLRALAIDIETRGHSTELYSIAAAPMRLAEQACRDALPATIESWPDWPGNTGQSHRADQGPDPLSAGRVFMIGEGNVQVRNGYELHFHPHERGLLDAFFAWLAHMDPDLLLGWSVVNFDLNFIDAKCRELGMPLALARGRESAAILQASNPGQARVARIPGRAVLDGIELLRAGFWAFDSFSLENVANELLGQGKLIKPEQNKVAEINHLFQHDKPTLADYNYRDCTLVNDIFDKADLIAFALERANLTGLPIDRLGGSVASFDNLYLPRLHRQGFVAPDVRDVPEGLASPGGQVLDSAPGLYRNVLVLDFKSLYPSIIRTYMVDPLGLAVPGEDPVQGFLEARFSRTRHILPGLIDELWLARDKARSEHNAPLSQAIKIIMNSFYGVLGSSGCRFHDARLASSITRRGHEIINRSREQIQARGYQVLYGDTDSLFILVGEQHTPQAAQVIGEELTRALNDWWRQTLQSGPGLESHLEIEFETLYTRFFMPTVRGMPTGSKKRYAGLVQTSEGQTLVVKGLEAARTDWTPLAREFQRGLFERVFHDRPFEAYVRDTAEALRRGELDDKLVYRKRLRRKLNDYTRNVPPHVQAARLASRPGNWIRYVITRSGPQPVEAISSPLDYEHYLERQLAPAADGILQFLGTGFASLTDAQLQMFR